MGVNNVSRGKYALVTGATSGFGYEFCKKLAADGFNLVVVATNAEQLRHKAADLTRSFMIEVLPISKDLYKPSAAEEIYAELKSKNIEVHLLVNDAGQGEHQPMRTTSHMKTIFTQRNRQIDKSTKLW